MPDSKQRIDPPKMRDDFEFPKNFKSKFDQEIMQKFIKSPWNDPDRAMGGKVFDDINEEDIDDADLSTV